MDILRQGRIKGKARMRLRVLAFAFTLYRIPRQLVTGKDFKNLSTDAKLLYGLLLDRMSLSARNGWYDGQGRVYIYYTAEEIREDLCCGNDKALKLLAELDTKKGFGLIERIKQGQGKPVCRPRKNRRKLYEI